MDELKISFFPKKGLDRHGFTGLRFHSTAQHSTAQHSTAQPSTAQHSGLISPFLRLATVRRLKQHITSVMDNRRT